jgi:uncharacterized protein (DUF305 family)
MPHKQYLLAALAALLVVVLASCNTQAPPSSTTDSSAHGGHSTAAADAPYDALFIDAMVVHHQGAIVMAKQAILKAERPELRQLAEAIIKEQEAEIAQLQQWRRGWFPDLDITSGAPMGMGPMQVADDPAKPFDQRFIEAMIPHHEAAVAMAREAQTRSEKPEITQLAGEIISAQEAEIAQMQQWLNDWYAVAQ